VWACACVCARAREIVCLCLFADSRTSGPDGGGTPLPWHQDGGDHWALDRDPLLFVWIALTQVRVLVHVCVCMRACAVSSHRLQLRTHVRIVTRPHAGYQSERSGAGDLGMHCSAIHVTCCTSHVTRHTSHVTRHTSHVTRHTSHVTRHTSHVTRHTSHVTRHTSHVTRHTSHVTRHTSHVTRHTPPVTRHTSHVSQVVKGSHKLGLLSRRGHTLCPEDIERVVGGGEVVDVELQPGDCFFCHNWTVHRR